mmetsp:Transcript_3273/g.7107  ORF Transcript_3273/g.7107 Transcript_3273/m.7107 type:complete len:942 (-) Transcript_3273:166-2991(-)
MAWLDKLSSWVLPHPGKKLVYALSEGSLADEAFLSRKGANLCELNRLGFNVPPAFILSADASLRYLQSEQRDLSPALLDNISHALAQMGHSCKKVFGATSGPPPLLVSVRGGALVCPSTDVAEEAMDSINTDIADVLGAPDSWCIPGVKESCLGLGMNDQVAAHLATLTNPFTAYNTYAHFLVRFGTIVLGVPRRHYRRVLSDHVELTGRAGVNLTHEDLLNIVEKFKHIAVVPSDPFVQLHMCLREMYRCWFSPEAVEFRSEGLGVDRGVGTAIIVQSIVFGGTGICFTRNPTDGEAGVFGTYWSRTGAKLALASVEFRQRDEAAFNLLQRASRSLEAWGRDMQQYEFVYSGEENFLYILQVLVGRRSPRAAMKIAVDLVASRLLTEREAIMRIDARKAAFFSTRHLTPEQLLCDPFGQGAPASRGVVTGTLAFTAAECMEQSLRGDTILCMQDCFPHDAPALRAASAVITLGGTIFSNTAILCRGMGKPCITTARLALTQIPQTQPEASISPAFHPALTNAAGKHLLGGSTVTIDGGAGRIFSGLRPTVSYAADEHFQTVLGWAEKFRTVRINALVGSMGSAGDLVSQVKLAKQMGADGLGVVSTNGMFRATPERLALTRSVLVRRSEGHLAALCELHREDFRLLLRTAQDRAVGIRLLDCHLGSFLPEEYSQLPPLEPYSRAEFNAAVRQLQDSNPDIGLRGCRITSFYPDITIMQVKALVSATLDLILEGLHLCPQILVPMVCTSHELQAVTKLIDRAAFEVYSEYKDTHPQLLRIPKYYEIGAMISTPRACLRAETLHTSAALFCTADLTTCTFGTSRGDADKFFPQYIFDKIYLADPFQSLDDVAVGGLVAQAVSKLQGRKGGKGQVHCSVVDVDHTSDPRSIDFFISYGVQALCCPAEKVPMARLAAAQSAIRVANRNLAEMDVLYNEYRSMLG